MPVAELQERSVEYVKGQEGEGGEKAGTDVHIPCKLFFFCIHLKFNNSYL